MNVINYGYIEANLSKTKILYTKGQYSPLFYVVPFCPHRPFANLRLGEFQCSKLSLLNTQACLGEFKMGRNCLQVKKVENNTGRK